VQPIGRTDIWLESLYTLCQRFLRLNPHQRGIDSPGDLENKIESRAGAVLDALSVSPLPSIATRHRWEVQWRPDVVAKHLKELLAARGQAVAVERDEPIGTYQLSGLRTEQNNVIILEAEAARERAQRLIRAGLLLKVGEIDGLILMMAEELYQDAAKSLPIAEPHPLIDNIAAHIVAQKILGLPFLPWVADLALWEDDE